MYWACFSSITSQPAMTTMTVMKLFRMTKGIEMPSTPSAYWTLKRVIQGACSTNCIPAWLMSKPRYRGSVTAKPARATARASQRI